ncbi:ornithine cyclodeaminase family protein [Glycomyces buryatensis]|uniref:Ornithine cyclodeaminase family protein n=1 Tax=Glycomyces buryatensis TaxID=2570927 RepID=A0A4S8QGY0_9ACTN|nr:ornithine cyclodeaminase family protein [Glycomyces buryatensis]
MSVEAGHVIGERTHPATGRSMVYVSCRYVHEQARVVDAREIRTRFLIQTGLVTLILSRTDITAAVHLDTVFDLLAKGFRNADAPRPTPMRIRADIPGPGTVTCLMPGLVPGIPAYTVKVNAKFPQSAPALRGVVCLYDLDTGELLALLDSASVTAWRTGLAAALATHTLAAPTAAVLGFVGAGAQAQTTLVGLRHLRQWDQILATDLHPERAADLPAAVAPDAETVAATADVVILATWSRAPLLHSAQTRPGQHLTSLGADEPGKLELSSELLTTSRVIVDHLPLAITSGALGSAGLGAEHCDGTIGQALRGELPATASSDRPTVYTPVGLPWQDLALSWAVYQHALTTATGTRIDLLALGRPHVGFVDRPLTVDGRTPLVGFFGRCDGAFQVIGGGSSHVVQLEDKGSGEGDGVPPGRKARGHQYVTARERATCVPSRRPGAGRSRCSLGQAEGGQDDRVSVDREHG